MLRERVLLRLAHALLLTSCASDAPEEPEDPPTMWDADPARRELAILEVSMAEFDANALDLWHVVRNDPEPELRCLAAKKLSLTPTFEAIPDVAELSSLEAPACERIDRSLRALCSRYHYENGGYPYPIECSTSPSPMPWEPGGVGQPAPEPVVHWPVPHGW